MAEAEGLGTSSSSCPCGRHWRPSRDSSVLHALARLPDRLASRRHSVCLGGNPCRGFRESTVNDAPRGCARRSTPACEPRAAALAVAPFARLELAREGHASADTPGDPGPPTKKGPSLTFFSSRPVSPVHHGWFVNAFQIGRMSFDQGWTCKRYTSLKSLCTRPDYP